MDNLKKITEIPKEKQYQLIIELSRTIGEQYEYWEEIREQVDEILLELPSIFALKNKKNLRQILKDVDELCQDSAHDGGWHEGALECSLVLNALFIVTCDIEYQLYNKVNKIYKELFNYGETTECIPNLTYAFYCFAMTENTELFMPLDEFEKNNECMILVEEFFKKYKAIFDAII